MLCTFMYVPLSSIEMLYVILDVYTAECQMHCEPTCMYVHCTLSSIATSTCCLIFGYTLCTTVSVSIAAEKSINIYAQASRNQAHVCKNRIIQLQHDRYIQCTYTCM